MEHLQHFGLSQDPFSNEPELRLYFESQSHRDAQRRVERGLRQHKGLTLLTGAGGMGKTLLARRILEGLEEEIFEATLLVMLPGAADATGTLQRFARQLGAEQPGTDRAGLLGQIYEQLAIVREDGRHAVLMIDDAQIMSPEVFAELGGLLNLEYEDRRLVSMLLVGSPELDRLIQNDASMMPRVDVRVRLQPLGMEDATAYLTHRIHAVRGDPAIVPPHAMEALYKFGRGRPRLLNTLADNALFEAYLEGRAAIDPSDVERAAEDLGIGADPGSTFSGDMLAMGVAAPSVATSGTQPVTSQSPPSAPAPMRAAPPISEEIFERGLEIGGGGGPVEAFGRARLGEMDLETGLAEALDELGDEAAAIHSAAGDSFHPSPAGPADLLDFDVEPPSAATAATEALELDGADFLEAEPVEAVFELEEASLAPLEPGERDDFDNVFVELIEE